MKIFLERAVFINRAPFERLDLFFDENEIAVLSGVNGKGKTTIISHIVDALHEIAKDGFQLSYEGIESKYYRIASGAFSIVPKQASIVYLRFKTQEMISNVSGTNDVVLNHLDYIDIRGAFSAQQYDELIQVNGKIPFETIQQNLNLSSGGKHFHNFNISESGLLSLQNLDFDNTKEKEAIQNIFYNNLLTHFPSYRYEIPYYLNDPYKIKLQFTISTSFGGTLPNPIDVDSCLKEIANWILDNTLDKALNSENPFFEANDKLLSLILTKVLSSKNHGNLDFGIAPRAHGTNRIQIVKLIDGQSRSIYKTIFNLSSGELALLCIFVELVRQFNRLPRIKTNQTVTGIVLIDEVDKHLHIKLQKEVLPTLFNLFPNVQFILSSHSPFLSMGLADQAFHRSKIYDLDNRGIQVPPKNNELYNEVFELMVNENENFKAQFEEIVQKINNDSIPLLITEGKTDRSHLLKAMQINSIEINLSFHEIPTDFGSQKLKALLENISNLAQSKKIIGIFDRDEPNIVSMVESGGNDFKSFGNNVYAFCLPIPDHRKDYTNISIEHFYEDKDLKKEHQGKSLYFDNEVTHQFKSAANKERILIKLGEPLKEGELDKKVFDQDIGGADWIHSKAVFADLVEKNAEFTKDFNYTHFKGIFDRIQEVLNHSDS